MNQYWYGVSWTFTCPLCKQQVTDKGAVLSESADPNDLKTSVNQQQLHCPSCRKLLKRAGKLMVEVNILPGTIEELRNLGYPLPFDPGPGDN